MSDKMMDLIVVQFYPKSSRSGFTCIDTLYKIAQKLTRKNPLNI